MRNACVRAATIRQNLRDIRGSIVVMVGGDRQGRSLRRRAGESRGGDGQGDSKKATDQKTYEPHRA